MSSDHDHASTLKTGVDRRAFLKGGAVAMVSLGFGSVGGPAFLHRAALATTPESASADSFSVGLG